MSLSAGTRLGAYEIVSLLGAGGMGEVYRAHDLNLHRDVAIKVLPDLFAWDPARLARFEREAQLLASLNHPNIATVHGLETSNGVRALVLELIEGPTLADRIAQSAVPLDEALPIARQIVDALEAAHEQGIIHRDLKPANIKVRPDGTVKVLDFGLAKLVDPPPEGDLRTAFGRPQTTASPTITSPAMTMAGVILGTAAYMSPEQAKGKPADKRSDIWAFGCVLFEMLTAKRAFGGEDIADTFANILRQEPDWSTLVMSAPPALDRLLHRCLAKDRSKRLADIADARLELETAVADNSDSPPSGAVSRRRAAPRWILWTAVLLTLASSGGALAVWSRSAPTAVQPIRFTVDPPEGWVVALDVGPGGAARVPVAVSPDGQHIAMLARNAEGRVRLWLRSLDSLTLRELPGTDNALGPFWSPDSRSLGFFADGRLKRIDIDGGTPVTLCSLPSLNAATWGRNGMIVIARAGGLGAGALLKVPDSGGVPAPASELGPDESMHIRPSFLPDGRHFVFRVNSPANPGGIFIGTIDSMERRPLLENQTTGSATYADGHLLFVRDGTLMAQPFDASALQLTGEVVPIVDEIQTSQTIYEVGVFSAAGQSVLAYQSGASRVGSQLAWVDRRGQPMGVLSERAVYSDVELSPSGEHVAVSIADPQLQSRDIYIIDVKDGRRTRFTFDPGTDQTAVWAPDGSRLVFNAYRRGERSRADLYEKSVNAATPEQTLLTDDTNKVPWSWSRDGRFIVFQGGRSGSWDLWALPRFGDRKPFHVVETPTNESFARISPDGRWLAYTAVERSGDQVYVVPFPGPGAPVQVSTGGGSEPRWRRDGKELYYLQGRTLRAATVDGDGPGFQVVADSSLFETTMLGTPRSNYDVAADGQRFLVNSQVIDSTSTPITVLLNWTAGLRK